jgi:flagellar hook protein FlgE
MSLIGTMGSGVTALRTFMKGLEVIGNNIANVNTTAFKGSDAKYADSFSTILQRSAAASTGAASISIGTGVKLSGVSVDYSQGSLANTGKETDLGVAGTGFFRVKDPSAGGSEYATRAGEFRWDQDGFLVTSQGYRVQGLTGTGLAAIGDVQLATPPTGTQLQSATIDRSGNVVEFYSDGTSSTSNQLLLQAFTDPSSLTIAGNNLFTGFLAAGPIGAAANSSALQVGIVNAPGKNGLGIIQSGYLELSNVNLTDQFANLITTQRSFQAASRLITVSDTILEDIVSLKRN